MTGNLVLTLFLLKEVCLKKRRQNLHQSCAVRWVAKIFFVPGVMVHGVGMFSLCMNGFLQNTLASSHS